MPTPLRTSSPALCGLLILASYLGVISKCGAPLTAACGRRHLGLWLPRGPADLRETSPKPVQFTEGETEARCGRVTGSRSHSWCFLGLRLESGPPPTKLPGSFHPIVLLDQ